MDTNQSETNGAASNEAVSQETSNTNLEATPAQPSNEAQKAEGQTTSIPESWEYNGDRSAVPEPFKNYAKGFDRAWNKRVQALAERDQKAREYEEFQQSEDWKTFQEFKKSGANKQPSQQQTSLISQDEIDAIALGDGKTLESVIERAVSKRLESSVNPIVQKQKALETAEYISEFTNLHPDFKEMLDSPAGEFMIHAAKTGASLEQIYETGMKARDYYFQQFESKKKADFEAKKNGSVVSKSIPGTPDVVYVDDENAAKRTAIEMTLRGDNRLVQVKPKKGR